MFGATGVVAVVLDWLVDAVEVSGLDWLGGAVEVSTAAVTVAVVAADVVDAVEVSGLDWPGCAVEVSTTAVTVAVVAADVVAGGDTPVTRGSYKALLMNFGNRNVKVVCEP
mmetsp:Transcript_45004/g.130188  ORF Transcript_45004/g.130188 Transcript_45004/m.130188 type:complete len:111 (+) Transcript_45004:1541-1873(+)